MVDQGKGKKPGAGAVTGPGPSGVAALPDPAPASKSSRDAIIDALLELAAEREWQDFSLSDVADRASVSLADFRDAFPSKGAVLAGFSRRIDQAVLRKTSDDLKDETAKERLFDVLMRRLDAMAPYKLGLEGISDWVRRDPLAAAALNRVAVNSMRFMLEASGIETEGQTGALKIQGLVIAWARILGVWFKEDDPSLPKTMAALDRELQRGETLAARVDDLDRLAGPVRIFARSLMSAGQRLRARSKTDATRAPSSESDPVS